MMSELYSCDVLYRNSVQDWSMNLFISASICFLASSVEKSKFLFADSIFEFMFIWQVIFGLPFSSVTFVFVLSRELILMLSGVCGVW